MDSREKLYKYAKVFFSAVVVLWIVGFVLVIIGLAAPLAVGFAEAGFGSLILYQPIIRDPFVWLELIALLVILIGIFSKQDLLVSIGAIIAAVIYILNATGLTYALLSQFQHPATFGKALSYFWAGRRRYLLYDRAMPGYSLIYTNIILLMLYFFLLLIASKKRYNSSILRVGTLALALIITIIHCIDSDVWGWRGGFRSYQVLPLILAIVRGICFALAPLFYIGSKEKKLVNGIVQNQTNKTNTIENLISLKGLLDKGIITQEEFENKKKEILSK